MHQDKNGVPVPWSLAFEQDAEKYPLLRYAIKKWHEEMDDPDGLSEPYHIWAEISCLVMREMARRLDVYHPNRNPLSNDSKR